MDIAGRPVRGRRGLAGRAMACGKEFLKNRDLRQKIAGKIAACDREYPKLYKINSIKINGVHAKLQILG